MKCYKIQVYKVYKNNILMYLNHKCGQRYMCQIDKISNNDDNIDIRDLSYRKKLVGKVISTKFKDIKHEKFQAHYLMLTKHFESQHTGIYE